MKRKLVRAAALVIVGTAIAVLVGRYRTSLPPFDLVAYCADSKETYIDRGPVPSAGESAEFTARNRAACQTAQRDGMSRLFEASPDAIDRCVTADGLKSVGTASALRCTEQEMAAQNFFLSRHFSAWQQGNPPLHVSELCFGYIRETGRACREDMTGLLAGLKAIRPSPDLVERCLPTEKRWRNILGRIAADELYGCVVAARGGEKERYGYAGEHDLR